MRQVKFCPAFAETEMGVCCVIMVPKIPNQGIFLSQGEGRESRGPFSLAEIKKRFAAGEIQKGTFLWFEGLENWITVGDLPDFDAREKLDPPPLPETSGVTYLTKAGPKKVSKAEASQMQKTGKIRRSDLVSEKRWVRADQHGSLKKTFRSPEIPSEQEKKVPNNWLARTCAVFAGLSLLALSAVFGAALALMSFSTWVDYEYVNSRSPWYQGIPHAKSPVPLSAEIKKEFAGGWQNYIASHAVGESPEEKTVFAENLNYILAEEMSRPNPNVQFSVLSAARIHAGKAFWNIVEKPKLLETLNHIALAAILGLVSFLGLYLFTKRGFK